MGEDDLAILDDDEDEETEENVPAKRLMNGAKEGLEEGEGEDETVDVAARGVLIVEAQGGKKVEAGVKVSK